MSEDEAVEKLNALTWDDQEHSHLVADDILLTFVPDAVRTAYMEARDRVGFWYA